MTISDHNAIVFRIAPHVARETQPYLDGMCFRIRNANWEQFDKTIERIANPSFKERLALLPPQQATVLLTEKLQNIM